MIRLFRKEANGTVTDTTKSSKLVKINKPGVSIEQNITPLFKPKNTPTVSDVKPAEPKPQTALQAMAEYERWQKQEKLNELKAKAQQVSEKIKGVETILTMPYQKAQEFKQIQQKHKELKAKQKALAQDMEQLGYTAPKEGKVNIPDEPKELYYVFDGRYYMFWASDRVWILRVKDTNWGWLKIINQDQRLANYTEFKQLVQNKYNEVELLKRFIVYLPTTWDLMSPLNSDAENSQAMNEYNYMKIDTNKATILY